MLISIIVVTAACARKEQRPASPGGDEKVPKGLQDIQDNCEKIIEEIEKLQQQIKKPVEPVQQQGKESGQQQGGQGGGGQSSGQENGQVEQGQQGGQSQQPQQDPALKKEQEIKKMWDGISGRVEEVHKLWNDYETTAVEDRVGGMEIKGFEDAINGLAMAVQQQETAMALMLANQASLHIAGFMDAYKDDPAGAIVRMRYYIQQTYIDAQAGDWDKAGVSINEDGRIAYEALRREVKLEEKDKQLMDKLDLALEDMGGVITNQDVELVRIKRDIALQNLDKIKEKAK
jgi:hypothetical protein